MRACICCGPRILGQLRIIMAPQENYFVLAAVVAADLHGAMAVARNIALTASNARALALRAGQGAAGFRAITDFIDELAKVTVNASCAINQLAGAFSHTSADIARAEEALERFDWVYERAQDSPYLTSLDDAYRRTQKNHQRLQAVFKQQVGALKIQLDALAGELRTATVLSAMSRVEASQAGVQFEGQLNLVAQNVADAAEEIQHLVRRSQQRFNYLV